MKKRLLASCATVLVTSMLVGGATLAIFTDTAASTKQFHAGTVDISANRDWGDAIPGGPMFYMTPEQGQDDAGRLGKYPKGREDTNPVTTSDPWNGVIDWWAPGDTESRQLDVANEGSLGVNITAIGATLRDLTPDTPAYNEFIDKMYITVVNSGGRTLIDHKPLKDFLVPGGIAIPTTLIAGKLDGQTAPMQHLSFTANLDISASNSIQGVAPVVDFSIYAEQE